MKKFFLFALLVGMSLVIIGCDKKEVRSAPIHKLTFEIESNPNYIGSYSIKRINGGQEWTEWGEWTPIQALVGREVVCFGYFGGSGTFRARSDYEWVQVEYDNRKVKCLELVKRK